MMLQASLESSCVLTEVLLNIKSSTDINSLTLQQRTLVASVLKSEDNDRVRVTATTAQELSTCVCAFAPFLTALKKKRGLVLFH